MDWLQLKRSQQLLLHFLCYFKRPLNLCTLTSSQIRIAMDWLRLERSEQLRYAAVLILRQMAANAPAVFNVFVRPFIDVIWAGLRDGKLLVREAATDALRVSTGGPLCQ